MEETFETPWAEIDSENDYPTLFSEHATRLRRIGVSPAQAEQTFTSIPSSLLGRYGYSKKYRRLGDGLLIFWNGLDGQRKRLADNRVPLTQFRPDRKLKGHPRYISPPGGKMGLYVHPWVIKRLKDHSKPIWLAESVIKAHALVARGQAALGINGCFGHSRDGEPVPDFADLNAIAHLRDRPFYLATDSDPYMNDAVREAWRRLVDYLRHEFGAAIGFVVPPPGRGGKKVGVDDFLEGSSLESLLGHYRTDLPELPMVIAGPWPEVSDDVMSGLAGEVVSTLAPHTEADPMGMLAIYLAEFGTFVGPRVHAKVGGQRHPARLFPTLVGRTARSRKGTAQAEVDRVFQEAIGRDIFIEHRRTGLSTPEGLIKAFNSIEDEDERHLLFVEEEFSKLLKIKRRESNPLSEAIRDLWDKDWAQVHTKSSPMKVDGIHLGFVGHITMPELHNHLPDEDTANGFANRFLWICVDSSDLKPLGGSPSGNALAYLGRETYKAIDRARGLGSTRSSGRPRPSANGTVSIVRSERIATRESSMGSWLVPTPTSSGSRSRTHS